MAARKTTKKTTRKASGTKARGAATRKKDLKAVGIAKDVKARNQKLDSGLVIA